MPKSKRNKVVDLSKTKKHGLEGKKKLFEEIHSCVESYANIFIFSVNDMRNTKIKNVRKEWRHSRFFIGKNKVMAKALGTTPEQAFRPNLHKIGERLKGERGLLFSNQSVEEVLKWFNSYSEGDYARSGNRATETVVLKEGPLDQFPHNLEPHLRQLGLPTTLKKGIIHLIQDHTVCNEGDVLTPETARILKLLGYEMAEFYIKIESIWSQDGTFTNLVSDNEAKENVNNINVISTKNENTSSADEEEMEITDDEADGVENDEADDSKENTVKIDSHQSVNTENDNDEIMEENTVEKEIDEDEEIPLLVEDEESKDSNSLVDQNSVDNVDSTTTKTDVISKVSKKDTKVQKGKQSKKLLNTEEVEEEEPKEESPLVRKLRSRCIKVAKK